MEYKKQVHKLKYIKSKVEKCASIYTATSVQIDRYYEQQNMAYVFDRQKCFHYISEIHYGPLYN
jgi:hypothetical protein